MSHQDVLSLTDAQRTAIVSRALAAQSRFPAAQHKLEAAVGKLVDALRPGRVDQSRALAQLDGVLARERDVKRLQMTLMIEVKNQLTPEQQAKAFQLAAAGSK
jgi:Spy/CpxP family protein refolding chaperone